MSAAAASGAAPDYLAEVKPLFTRHCVGCHGADQQKGGLRLDTARAAREGGESGPAYLPGNPDGSLLVRVLEGDHPGIPRMPYKRDALPPHEIDRIRAWITAGADAPREEEPGRQVHWAFVAPERPVVPAVTARDWARNPIDHFVAARLEREGIAPSPEADRITLLRRLSLDLTGLPPSPEEVDAFLADTAPDAYLRRVDALLDSPHYGERWARWWLDVARYADSNGYSIDAPRSMWPWRDWVIRAFNRNLPFDQFIVEQIAGDLLPDATLEQRVATGFHRNTQINQEGGIDPEQFRIESVIDRVNTTGTAFLGLTVACAQCHDHKFDPITQREYFELFAFFNDQDEPTLSLPTPGQSAALAAHDAEVRRVQAELRRLEARIKAEGREDGNPVPGGPGPVSGNAEDLRKSRDQLAKELERLRRARPSVDTTLVLAERPEPRESRVFIKGDFTRPGAPVEPGTPAILHPIRAGSGGDGGRRLNRLDLARWLVDRANPLTARVIVNRVWQQYFGLGLVETENDFGTQGIPPTHPELLDWLATEFMDSGWDLKRLHRLIATSATYRQSSKARPELEDPSNRLLARQRRLRLDAEIIRDVALVASGRLDRRVGGPGVFPPQPDGVMNLGQSRRAWVASTGGDRHRRGLYTFYWRATPHPALAVFDAPDSFSACTRRPRSNTPLQALTLLNDAAFVELANALARRLEEIPDEERQVETAFRLCVSRPPNPAERQRLLALVREEASEYGPDAARQTLARVVLNLDETITRE